MRKTKNVETGYETGEPAETKLAIDAILKNEPECQEFCGKPSADAPEPVRSDEDCGDISRIC